VTAHIRARGSTLAEAFVRTALAVFGTAFDPSAIAEREVREVRAHGSTVEALLAAWINECVYVLDVEGFACRRIDFAVFETSAAGGGEPMRLHSFLHGEVVEADQQEGRGSLGPVSAAGISVERAADGYEITMAV